MAGGYLLDTNVISELLRASAGSELTMWIAGVPFTDQFISSITLGELFRGAFRLKASDRHLKNIRDRVVPNVMVLPFDAVSAELYGTLHARLFDAGSPLEDFDLMIAAVALQHDLTLVTRNVKHFRRIENLSILETPGAVRA